MATSKRVKDLESKLTPQQRKAAFLLVENDLRGTSEKKTQEQIAAEVEISYKTLWEWRTRNRNFIAYKNAIADDFLAEYRSTVYSQLMKLINGKQPSVKAIDLYLKRFGLLTEKTQVETVDSSGSRSNEDIAKDLEEIDELLNDKDV